MRKMLRRKNGRKKRSVMPAKVRGATLREREERADQDRREREDRADRERRDREAVAQATQLGRSLQAQIEQLQQLAREQATKRVSDNKEQDSYNSLLKDLKEGGIAARLLTATNPFATAARFGAREVDKSLLDMGLNATLPLGPEVDDPIYDNVAGATTLTQSLAMRYKLCMGTIDQFRELVFGLSSSTPRQRRPRLGHAFRVESRSGIVWRYKRNCRRANIGQANTVCSQFTSANPAKSPPHRFVTGWFIMP